MNIILLILLIGVGIYAYGLHKQKIEAIQINEKAIQQNRELAQEISSKKKELSGIKESVRAQNEMLESVYKAGESLRLVAEERAEEAYKARFEALSADYEQLSSSLDLEYKEKMAKLTSELENEQHKVDDLKAKQLAYIQAKQREEEIKAKESYYKLGISEEDKQDIELFRELQRKVGHKDAIDKVIWDIYYKPAYDALMPRLFKKTVKISGIYRITDLISGQSYVGQSVDMRERMRQHIKTAISSSPATNKLYQAMKKDGLWNFTFEVLEEVPKDKLNERETYYIELYQTKTAGLNKTIGGA